MKIQDLLIKNNVGKIFVTESSFGIKYEFCIVEEGEGYLDLIQHEPNKIRQDITNIFYLSEILNMDFKEKS